MNTRSQQEIEKQIKELLIDKANLPEQSLFGTPNHKIIDTQIRFLKGEIKLEDLPDGDWGEQDAENEIYTKVQEAEEWLKGQCDLDLFDLRDEE